MTKHIVRSVVLLVGLTFMMACSRLSSGSASESSVKLDTEDQKTLYALGLFLGRNVKSFNLKPEELVIVKAGLTDSVNGTKPQVDLEAYGPKLNELHDKRASVGSDDEKKKGKEFAD